MKMTKSIDVFLTDGCGRCSKFGTDDCSVRVFSQEIEALRSIALSVFEEETMKWGAPCYSHNGKNVVMLFSFKDNCGFSFFKVAFQKANAGVYSNTVQSFAKCGNVLRWTTR